MTSTPISFRPNLGEVVLAAFSFACVVVFALDRLRWLPGDSLSGLVAIGLYPLFSCAAATGWVLGNLYVRRATKVEWPWRWTFLLFYLLAPIGPFFLLRAMAPMQRQLEAPLVPWLCAGIVFVFFLVPITIRPRTPIRSPRIGKRDD